MASDPHPRLYVEGRDDQWAILSLLAVNGITLKKETGPVVIQPVESVSTMLDRLVTFIKPSQAKGQPVGFVLDIDVDLDRRWNAIRSKLVGAGHSVPNGALSQDGVILVLKNGPVGFWLMPDNLRHEGKLEDFLRTLIPADDLVLPLAEKYVEGIKDNVPSETRFRDVDREKSVMSSWLAVRNPPGLPYGTAITARTLLPTSPVAERFVSWFCRLYGVARDSK